MALKYEPLGKAMLFERTNITGIKADLRKSQVKLTITLFPSDENRAKCDKLRLFADDAPFDVTVQPPQEIMDFGKQKQIDTDTGEVVGGEPTKTQVATAVAEKLLERAESNDGKRHKRG